MKSPVIVRRSFIRKLGLVLAPVSLSWNIHAAARATLRPVRFGLCADPHKDIMHDADERLRMFLGAARKEKAEFILQLGDFCRPYEKNREFLKIWEDFTGGRHHTLGNHDNDGGFTWQQVMDFLGMKSRYYSFDHGGWHFIVLDGNEKKPVNPAAGYPRHIGADQLAWLGDDLGRTTVPTLVFSHQSLEDDEGVENRAEVRGVLEKANATAGWHKVGACMSGHHHIDFQREINGIQYIQINSMSYSWLGESYKHIRYSPDVDKEHPYIKYTAPYKDALFGLCSLDPDQGLSIRGVRSEFVGPSPWDLGMPDRKGTSWGSDRLVPGISDRKIAM